ncbi:MAG: DUF507 family protein [Helicobacteraceae bacterium]|jgi:hypothetical protein|nr:DUF507 family protein [Helicobacteraceae bacterium]
MRLSPIHARFISEKIAHELLNSQKVSFTQGDSPVISAAVKRINEEIELEKSVDTAVKKFMDDYEDDINLYQADRNQVFWLIKRRFAPDHALILEKEERFNALAHKILDDLYEDDLINYRVEENIVKNLICKAILDFGRRMDQIEDKVHEKIRAFKRRITRGDAEYEILYEKFYHEELSRLGL